jgi:hypothetical protein
MLKKAFRPEIFMLRRVAEKKQREYEALKRAIYAYLRCRNDFCREVDSALIEQTARLYADWLYVEELLGKEEGKAQIWKYADALAKIHSMLMVVLDELKLTPKVREKIAQDLVESDDIMPRLKKLVEGK